MKDSFLSRYQDELLALRKKAALFADAFPALASKLRLTREVADDPHVERLLQGFAFAAARIRQKIDDSFPELTTELLEGLYPHFLAPLPSTTIVRIDPISSISTVNALAASSEFTTDQIDDDVVKFRTTQDVELTPLRIRSFVLSCFPLSNGAPIDASGCLTISLHSTNDRADLRLLGLKKLRFYLCAPWNLAVRLHDLVCNRSVAVAYGGEDVSQTLPSVNSIQAGGFSDEEALFPFPKNSFSGYRLLSEFFVLPQKFLFFEVHDVEFNHPDRVDIHIYLDCCDNDLESKVSACDIALHATPAVNLFDQACEPIRVDGLRTEYRLLPDSRYHQTREIYAIKDVRVSASGEHGRSCPRYFSQPRSHQTGFFWQMARHVDDHDGATEIEIALLDRENLKIGEKDLVLSVDALCSNRDLVEKVPYGGSHPHLHLSSNNDVVESIVSLQPFTKTARRSEHSEREWGLISHLALNHGFLSDSSGTALKRMLHLYSTKTNGDMHKLIEAIVHVECNSVTGRLGTGEVLQGVEIKIEFDIAEVDRSTVSLFGRVLDHFFGRFAPINNFTKLSLHVCGETECLVAFAPKSGSCPLV